MGGELLFSKKEGNENCEEKKEIMKRGRTLKELKNAYVHLKYHVLIDFCAL